MLVNCKLCDKEIERLKAQLAMAKEVIIFYSNAPEYEETHNQLDWIFVNNGAAIQDYGKFAREALNKMKDIK